ncbi:biotin-dependent carboxyltransferase family protein [Postechiella marina]|uniref:Biotin-dependent carboxyltransferase family protein n=1 Tax=Postechiella marina TaxID=943941 RepID=A0ABP8CG05_9FLAO
MIKVLHAGFYTTVQDFGRIGFQEYGVPYSGVMDRKSAEIANALLGNSKNEAVIEMTMTGAKLLFNTATYIVISGADMSAKLNGLAISINKVINIKANDILSFGKLHNGFRSYLAVLGGFSAPEVMQSKSMYQNITKQIRLNKNDELQIKSTLKPSLKTNAFLRVDASYIASNTLSVFKGPEFNELAKDKQKQLFFKPFTVSKQNNRMAYQLEETVTNSLAPIITAPVLPGTVQLTPSGKLIVLMRDCQTTGGYPRVLQLSKEAINLLSQKFTGCKISLNLISKF